MAAASTPTTEAPLPECSDADRHYLTQVQEGGLDAVALRKQARMWWRDAKRIGRRRRSGQRYQPAKQARAAAEGRALLLSAGFALALAQRLAPGPSGEGGAQSEGGPLSLNEVTRIRLREGARMERDHKAFMASVDEQCRQSLVDEQDRVV